MNAATDTRPEVLAFVDRVRQQLGDLDVEERDELLDGLEADLSEQVAAGDPLPDPVAYAAELRSAAGVSVVKRTRKGWLTADEVLDQSRARWLAWTQRSEATRQAWAVVEPLRPAWWVLRAWLAVTFLDQVTGPWEYVTLWPTLGAALVGPFVLVVAVVLSALIGLNGLWPGSGPDRKRAARLVLLALNVFAVVVPLTFAGDGSQQFRNSGATAVAVPARQPGADVLRHGREVVRNIYAYDVDGQPLQGVQLFDQQGRPIAVAPQSSMGSGAERQVTCPWFNGATPLFNVFPLPQRAQRYGTCVGKVDPAKVGPQAFHEPPLASVPAAALPAPPEG